MTAITPILFFKRLSDVYDEETQIALEESDGDEEYASFPENHSFVIPEGCHWKDVREASENVWPKIEDGTIKPSIYKILPITDAEAAHAILERGENVGKVVLSVCDE